MNNIQSINNKIATLAQAEKVTKAVLAELSRDLIDYVLIQEIHDIAAVNRTLAVLTPMNKATAVQFFQAFLPHKFNEDTQTFGGLDKKIKPAKMEASKEFMADENNNIWTWAAVHVEVKAKEKDYLGNVTKAVKQAIDKGQVEQVALIQAVLSGGVDVATLMLILTQQAEKPAVQELDRDTLEAIGEAA